MAVDEISIKKGHCYLTVVLDYLSGRVVWVGKERTEETLDTFFAGMTEEQRQALEAIAMDMWDPYIHAGKKEMKLQGIPHYNRVSEIALITKVGNSKWLKSELRIPLKGVKIKEKQSVQHRRVK